MKRSLHFTSHLENLTLVRAFVGDFLERAKIDEKHIYPFVLAVDEAVTNVVRHAYHSESGHPITLSMQFVRGKLTCKLRDEGAHLDKKMFPQLSRDAMRQGGLGLHFIAAAFEEVVYKRKRPGTELVLTRMLPQNEG